MADPTIRNLYYNDKTGYTGIKKLYERAKARDNTITMSDVRAFLDKQYTHQINRSDVRPKHYRTILANKPRDNYQMDLMIYNRFEKDGYKYILTCIDVNSRYAVAIPLKTREVLGEGGVLKAVKTIFKKMGIPKHLNCDQEFIQSRALKDYLDGQRITLHVSDTDEINKNAIIERFHRTIALLMKRWRDASSQNRKWYSVLDHILDNYNTSYHSTIKTTPEKVWEGNDENRQSPIYTFESEIGVGDLVRVKQLKTIFGKGDALKYSKEIYQVVEQKEGREKKYKLKDIKSGEILKKPRQFWKEYEIKKVDAIVETQDETEEPEKEETKPTRKHKRALKELESGVYFGEPKDIKRQRKINEYFLV